VSNNISIQSGMQVQQTPLVIMLYTLGFFPKKWYHPSATKMVLIILIIH